jgi:hypothetical protein
VFRRSFEATLRSAFGEQRLSRAKANTFSRMTLVPREALPSQDPAIVGWRDGHYVLEVLNHEWAVSMAGSVLPLGPVSLVDGAVFAVGQTEVSFHLVSRSWAVDVDRERALLERDDAAGWSIYADELLAQGDPLGLVLARAGVEGGRQTPSSGEPDVAFLIEVSPLVAQRSATFVSDARGLWREVTFRHELTRGSLEEGVIAAVLGHPLAWFAQRVTLELRPTGRRFRVSFLREANRLVGLIGAEAGPHLQVVSISRLPAGASIASPRAGVEIR